jgi:hypothetical protein
MHKSGVSHSLAREEKRWKIQFNGYPVPAIHNEEAARMAQKRMSMRKKIRLFPKGEGPRTAERPMPNLEKIHQELSRRGIEHSISAKTI